MKTVPIQELKRRLSALIDAAAAGERVLVTRHRVPVALLTSAGLEHVHVGRKFGRGTLRPLMRRATKGRFLDVLAEDRALDR